MSDHPLDSESESREIPMTPEESPRPISLHDLAKLGCRILALFFVVQVVLQGLRTVMTLLAYVDISGDVGWSILFVTFFPITYGILAWLLWVKADWLASRMVSPHPTLPASPSLRFQELLSVAIAGGGIYLVIISFRGLVDLFAILPFSNISLDDFFKDENIMGQCLTNIVSMLIGLYLTLGSAGLSRFVARVRNVDEP